MSIHLWDMKPFTVILIIFVIKSNSLQPARDSGKDYQDRDSIPVNNDRGIDKLGDSGINFVLFTKSEPLTEKVIYVDYVNKSQLQQLGFDPEADTKIICHGWKGNLNNGPGKLLRPAYFAATAGPINIILVDWSKYAGLHETRVGTGLMVSQRRRRSFSEFFNIFYFDPAKKTMDVGRKTAQLVKVLIEQGGTSLSKIHLIGHSLGAQAMGWAGRLLDLPGKVSRLTVLDAAGPCFEPGHDIECPSSPSFIPVDHNDAEFVDAIHTDSEFMGMRGLIGQADFFPNGGTSQPNCGHLLHHEQCSHHRAVELFAETVNPSDPKLKPLAYKCDSWDEFERGACFSAETALMGEHCSTSSRGQFYLRVTDKPPFFVNE